MDDKEKERTIRNLQMLEQNLQQILMQKQAFQMELRETQSAMKELEKSGEEVFKIIGQMMIKSDKKSMIAELANKEKLMDLRIRNFEKQEIAVSKKIEEIQKEITQ